MSNIWQQNDIKWPSWDLLPFTSDMFSSLQIYSGFIPSSDGNGILYDPLALDAFLCEPANWMQNAQYDSLTVFQLTATKTKIWPIKHRNSRSAATYNQKLSSQSHLHTWSWVRRRTTGLPSLNQMKKSLIYSNLLCHWEAHGSSCKCHKMCLDKKWAITHLHTNMPSAKATKESEELLKLKPSCWFLQFQRRLMRDQRASMHVCISIYPCTYACMYRLSEWWMDMSTGISSGLMRPFAQIIKIFNPLQRQEPIRFCRASRHYKKIQQVNCEKTHF